VTAYHQYCRFKQREHDPFLREDYFLKHVLTQISSEDQLIWEPACRELEQLIRSTRHYHLKKRIQSS
ncbi:MAG: hypothetical protein KH921_18950, partial [Erysipelotrichaceae bacterium]|nr:hypothetical protein [Erysipelotrichaceae bacterium]